MKFSPNSITSFPFYESFTREELFIFPECSARIELEEWALRQYRYQLKEARQKMKI